MLKQACQCDGPEFFRKLELPESPGCAGAVVLSRRLTDSPEVDGWRAVSGVGEFCPACDERLTALVEQFRPLVEAIAPAPVSTVDWNDEESRTKFGLGP